MNSRKWRDFRGKMATWAGFSEEELRKVKQQSVRGNNQVNQSGFHRREPGRNPHRRMPPSETITSDTTLDPSMSLKAATQSHSSKQLSSHRVPKELQSEKLESPDNTEQTQTHQDVREKEEAINGNVKEEIPDDVDLNDTEALSRDMKSLEKFREQQKAIEEANKQKKALLSKTLTERRKKAQAEAHKLEHIQKELAKLDSLLTADVQVIRDRIEGASRDFLEAQKRFQKAEAEYVDSKMDLHEKSEQKEQLTEHLYTIIHQNEVRKAKKLANLMKELEMDSTEEEFHLPELPPLSSFSPIHHGQLSPGIAHPIHPVIENGPTNSTSENTSDNIAKETDSDKSLAETVTENSESHLKPGEQNSVSEASSSHSPENKSKNNEVVGCQSEPELKKTDNDNSKTPENVTESPKPDQIPDTGGDKIDSPNTHSIAENPDSVKVGQVSQYVRDRKAQVHEELETVQNLIKETESGDMNVTEQGSEQAKVPSSWDFSGEVNSIGAKEKS